MSGWILEKAGRHRILSRPGEAAWAYAAHDERLDRQVARGTGGVQRQPGD